MDRPTHSSVTDVLRRSMLGWSIGAAPLLFALLALCGCGTLIAPSAQKIELPISLQESSPTVQAGGIDMLTAVQQGTALAGGQWLVSGSPSAGTIDANGLYHAPASITAATPITINYGMGDQISSITIVVEGAATPPITVAPTQPTVQVQGTDTFLATQQGGAATGGQWVVLGGSANGSIDAEGNYTAPAAIPSPSGISVGYIFGSSVGIATITIVDAAPTITSVLPAEINHLSTAIQIVGSGFLPNSIISVGATPLATTYTDASHLSAVVTLSSPLTSTLQITVSNPGNGSSKSDPFAIQAIFPALDVQPATLAGGPVTLTIAGSGFAPGDAVSVNGAPFVVTVTSATSITATGFLAPWATGSALVQVSAGDGAQPIAAQEVPIQTTPVTYDAASRFSTQAAMGQRPDVVQSIQTLGFDAWITQQFEQPPIAFGLIRGGKTQLIENAMFGDSLLRQRLALALQSFIVPQDEDFDPSSTFYEDMLERDCSGNFRQLLTDIAGSPNLTTFLNLPNNHAATDPIVQPNQNFAREIMQLFTLGPFLLNDDGSVQTDGQGNPLPTYTQDTVIDMTRALTGWTYPASVNADDTMWGIDFSQPLTAQEPYHDINAKLLFGSVVLPAGQTAEEDRQMALDAIFNHPNLPPFISHLLIQRLVKSDPSPAYIQRISTVFEDNGSGVRGDLNAVIRAILLDPEARAGDTSPTPSDGFLQEPFLWQMSIMSIVGDKYFDDQVDYVAQQFGQNLWNAPTVFGFFSPSYTIPGTNIVSPEFQLQNNLSVIQKSGYLWQLISIQAPGGSNDAGDTSWLLQNFTTVPTMLDALNHLVYHGQMPQAERDEIIAYCSQLNPFETQYQLQIAMFLALNADSFNVAH